MSAQKVRVPAVEGWFDMDPDSPRLVGGRCTSCGTYSFPRETIFCKNPACDGSSFDEVRLSARGKIWSYTNSCYKPPAPFVAPDPFEPFALAAVELAEEKMVVLGQLATGVTVDDVTVGQEVELVLETLFEDDEQETIVWKWRPIAG